MKFTAPLPASFSRPAAEIGDLLRAEATVKCEEALDLAKREEASLAAYFLQCAIIGARREMSRPVTRLTLFVDHTPSISRVGKMRWTNLMVRIGNRSVADGLNCSRTHSVSVISIRRRI
jgi:hypothetical protein